MIYCREIEAVRPEVGNIRPATIFCPAREKFSNIYCNVAFDNILKHFSPFSDFTEVDKKAQGLLCCESVSVFKDYKIICYYVTKHAGYVIILSVEPRKTRAKYLD
ncbi:hypothetical protein RF11_03487 [Thelohanellus kitauei]|uniref:Uncharacterized protein n=1 Tax=Thelohanellus kitauei TaxID=669202 RepID=A0A0C2MA82_THEKT|nr:hypothetical protein RF11_03487 [Thelohanellus kitauei]